MHTVSCPNEALANGRLSRQLDTFLLSLSLPSTCCQHHMRDENHWWANSPSRARLCFLSHSPHFPHKSHPIPPTCTYHRHFFSRHLSLLVVIDGALLRLAGDEPRVAAEYAAAVVDAASDIYRTTRWRRRARAPMNRVKPLEPS